MKYLRYCLCLPLICLALLAQAQSQTRPQPQVEMLELQHRQAADIVDQLMALYPRETVFSADGQRLMVKADPAMLAEIQALVSRLDVAPAQLRITLRRQQQGQGNDQRSGSRTLSTNARQNEQSIVVQDGETARIEAGSIRRVTRAARSGDMVALINEDTPLTRGFLVQPRALGSNQVELRVVAFDNSAPRHRAQGSDVETAAVVTMRRVDPGEWVPLGSSSEQSASERSAQVYSTARAGADNQRWSIRVDILP